ncbi:MAG: hypothetical protein ACJA2Q_000976 [Pseudohongiellaceae bacterium]
MNRANFILTGFAAVFLAFAPVSLLAASARINYLLYCTGCHGITGEGSPPNVPTLVGELGDMIQIPEMRNYLVQIPGAASAPINDMELTAVINWILHKFNADTLPNDFEDMTTSEVSKARKNVLADPLKYRITHWKDYPK